MRRLSLASIVIAVVALALTLVPGGVHAQPNVTGQWSTLPYLAAVNPIHVAVLNTGKVLMVEGSSNDPNQVPTYRYAIWDPQASAFTTVGTTTYDLFCNSMAFLPDGRLLISGGNLGYNPFRGTRHASIFDPATEKFVQVEDMAKGRWYPTIIGLSDGGMFTFAGLDETAANNATGEIYDIGAGWAGPYPAGWDAKYYPRLHMLNNGKVLLTGPDPFARIFDPVAGTWSSTIAYTIETNGRMYGSSVLLPLTPQSSYHVKIFTAGGNTTTPTKTAEIFDTSNMAFRRIGDLDQPRVTQNAVLLPNGKVLVVGGSSQFNVAATGAMNALMWDPATEGYAPAGTIAYPRMYHSTAVLLPDMTVWLGGSQPQPGSFEQHMEVYKPPYLFTSGGALATRPAISSAPSVIGYGDVFQVGTPNAANIQSVFLMRTPSATHAFDMEQRLIYMNFTKGTNVLNVTAPTVQAAALPGYYYLVVMDSNGVPSVAKFIRIANNPGNQAPVATVASPTSTTVSPGNVTFAAPGTYTVSLTVLDDKGDNNTSPPVVTVNVQGTAQLGAQITSPANGATITSGSTVSVNMAATNAQGSPTQFTLKLDNATTLSSQSITSGSTATFSWNTTGVAAGAHTLNLAVTDGAGRTASTSISVTIGSSGGGGTWRRRRARPPRATATSSGSPGRSRPAPTR